MRYGMKANISMPSAQTPNISAIPPKVNATGKPSSKANKATGAAHSMLPSNINKNTYGNVHASSTFNSIKSSYGYFSRNPFGPIAAAITFEVLSNSFV